MSNNNIFRGFLLFACSGFLLYWLSPIITPFFLGALLAYLGNPIVTYLNTKHLPRVFGVLLVFTSILLLSVLIILLLLPLIQDEIDIAVQKIPGVINWFQSKISLWVSHHPGSDNFFNTLILKKKLAENSQKITHLMTGLIQMVTQSTFVMLDFVMNLLLVPVVAFYLMRDWPLILQNIHDLLPKTSAEKICLIARQSDDVISAFFKGQLLVMLGLTIIYSTGLWLVGLQVAFFVGLISGLLAMVPYLGFTIGIIIAGIAMYFETYSFIHVLYVCGVYSVGQMAESMVLTPCLVGDKIGLHPVAVIFAILLGGYLFGFLGVLLALPLAAVIWVILKNMISRGVRDAVSF